MRKQTLFDLSSLPKMILIVTLIVMTGVLYGAISYLLKTSNIDIMRNRVNSIADKELSPDDLIPSIEIDTEIFKRNVFF